MCHSSALSHCDPGLLPWALEQDITEGVSCQNTGEGGESRRYCYLVGGGWGPPPSTRITQPRVSSECHPALSKLGAISCSVTKLGDLLLDTGREASSPDLLVLGRLPRTVGMKACTAILAKHELM